TGPAPHVSRAGDAGRASLRLGGRPPWRPTPRRGTRAARAPFDALQRKGGARRFGRIDVGAERRAAVAESQPKGIVRADIVFEEKDRALREDVHRLGTLVGELVREQGGEALFDLVEAARRASIQRREGD